MSTIHFETLGCKLNQVETEGIARSFSDAGFDCSMEAVNGSTPSSDDVILCVINTCTVTAKAEQKARRIIRMLLSKFPECAVAVTGCYAQVESAFLRSMDERICVLGGQHKGVMADVPALIQTHIDQRGQSLAHTLQSFFDEKSTSPTPAFRLATDTFAHHSRSSLKIQDGCNCVCTYCRIRIARGKSVSLGVEEVLSQVKALEEAGQNEVVITTVNIAQYCAPWKGGMADFATLLEEMINATDHIFFRISSLYPEIVTDRLASIIAHPRVQSHFHLSIQSGSDAVLKKMKRPYKIEAVYKAIERLKKAKGNPFLACDIIAGFPGESDQDFEETKRLCTSTGMTFVHAFPFSPRPGTEAYSMRPMVANNITSERIAWLEDFSRKSKTAYIESFVGQELKAVCETVHRKKLLKDKVIVHAVTGNFLHCQLVFSPEDKNIPQPGSVVTVKIRRPLNANERTGESDTLAQLA